MLRRYMHSVWVTILLAVAILGVVAGSFMLASPPSLRRSITITISDVFANGAFTILGALIATATTYFFQWLNEERRQRAVLHVSAAKLVQIGLEVSSVKQFIDNAKTRSGELWEEVTPAFGVNVSMLITHEEVAMLIRRDEGGCADQLLKIGMQHAHWSRCLDAYIAKRSAVGTCQNCRSRERPVPLCEIHQNMRIELQELVMGTETIGNRVLSEIELALDTITKIDRESFYSKRPVRFVSKK
jgi:hypothetical protein